MADAAPPDAPQVQLEALRAFTKDLELAVRTEAKGYATKPVSAAELHRWLEAALASNVDEAQRPQEGIEGLEDGTLFLYAQYRQTVLKKLLARVTARVKKLEKQQLVPKDSTLAWARAQLDDLAKGHWDYVKSGDVSRAIPAELLQWVDAGVPDAGAKKP